MSPMAAPYIDRAGSPELEFDRGRPGWSVEDRLRRPCEPCEGKAALCAYDSLPLPGSCRTGMRGFPAADSPCIAFAFQLLERLWDEV